MKCHCCDGEYHKISKYRYRCESCGHQFVDWDLDPIKWHGGTYRRLIGDIKNDKLEDKFHNIRRPFAEKRIEYLEKYLSPEYSMLDVGGGGGTFANLAKRYVKEVTVCELDETLLDECERLGLKTIHSDFLDIKGPYDFITCFHMIEHVVDIWGAVNKIFNLTRDKAAIEVPINRNILKKLKFSGHFHDFTQDSFVKLLNRSGFDIVDVNDGAARNAAMMAIVKK